MTNFTSILDFTRPEFIRHMHVSRHIDQGLLEISIQVKTVGGDKEVILSGFNELAEAISQLVLAERVIISREINTGKEFGTFRIECWVDETYSEFWCDLAKLQ